jgi:hypothetical protein
VRMCVMCAEIVFGETTSSCAICRLVSPAATSPATSNSRSLSGCHGSLRPGPHRAALSVVDQRGGPGRRREGGSRPAAGRPRPAPGFAAITAGPARPGALPEPWRGHASRADSTAWYAAEASPRASRMSPGRGRSRAARRDGRAVSTAPLARHSLPRQRRRGPVCSYAGEQVREQARGVHDLGRGLVAALAKDERRVIVPSAPRRLGQAPQRRRQPLQLGHTLTRGERLSQQVAGGAPVTAAHREVAQNVLRGDPGGDATAPVRQCALRGLGRRIPLTSRPLHMGQVTPYNAGDSRLRVLRVTDALGEPALGAVVFRQF